jgi:nitrous oxidase accessory protein NosD
VHRGPLVLDYRQVLDGEPGAVVRGGILVRADGVTIRDVTVIGGVNGIDVDDVTGVVLDRVSISEAQRDGIHVRRGSVQIRNCRIDSGENPWAQGIDISFSFHRSPSLVEDCTVTGGMAGIVSHSSRVMIKDNIVRGTALRGIDVTEMSMGDVSDNRVENAVGVGIFCGDYSMCEIRENVVIGTRADAASQDRSRLGYAVQAHYHAHATVRDNALVANPFGVAAFAGARLSLR